MKRFNQLLSVLPTPLKPSFLPVGIDLGSSTTRVRVGDSLRLQQPTCTVTHGSDRTMVALGAQAARYQPGLHHQTLFRAPVRKGVITDIDLATDYLKAVFNQVIRPQELTILTQITGRCVIPSRASKVERYIFQKMFERFGEGQWQLIPKAQLWQELLSRKKAGLEGVIDMGGDTTEVVLLTNQNTLSETIPFGGRQLIKRLLQLVRAEYGFQLSWESGESLLKDIDLLAMQQDKRAQQITIRGKNITNGRPETMVISSEIFNKVVTHFYQELLAFIQLFFSQLPTSVMTKSLDSGLLLSGGLSQVSGSAEYIGKALGTQLLVSKNPQEDLIRHIW
jgi:rod shape-determining protein MreB